MSSSSGGADVPPLTRLAWNVYKACKSAPDSFGDIANEVHALEAVLKETDETLCQRDLSAEREEDLENILHGCHVVLNDVDELVKKYHSLTSQTKTTWDRMKWHSEDVAGLRTRLRSHVTMLTGFISTSQGLVEVKLEQLLRDYQEGTRGGSAMSTRTLDCLTLDEDQAWPDIIKELEDVGISRAAFNANKEFILRWLQDAAAAGALDEQPVDIAPIGPSPKSDDGKETAVFNSAGKEVAKPNNSGLLYTYSESSSSRSQKDQPQRSSLSKGNDNPDLIDNPFHALAIKPRGEQKQPLIREKPSRTARLLSRVQRPAARLLAAIKGNHLSDAEAILKNPDMMAFVPHLTITEALVTLVNNGNSHPTIIELLLMQGAAPYAKTHARNDYHGTILHEACRSSGFEVVELLLQYGSDTGSKDDLGDTALHVAVKTSQAYNVVTLLKYGASPNEENANHETPLTLAIAKRQSRSDGAEKAIVGDLLFYGADLNHKGSRGQTPLEEAVSQGQDEYALIILQAGADIGSNFLSKSEALCALFPRRHWTDTSEKVALQFLESGADINATHNEEFIRLGIGTFGVQEGKFDVSASKIREVTALLTAALFSTQEAVRFLLNNGAKVLQKDSAGKLVSDYVKAKLERPFTPESRPTLRAILDILEEHQRLELSTSTMYELKSPVDG